MQKYIRNSVVQLSLLIYVVITIIKVTGEHEIMIEKVLEAYEAKTAVKGSFWEKLNKMDRLMKIVFLGSVASGVVVLGLALFIHTQAVFIAMIVYIFIIYIATISLDRMRHSKWEANLKEYNEDLNTIAEILREEFDLYEKNKIKQLIYKYHQSIERHETKNTKKNSEIKEFICTYIVPVIAFFAGKININDSSNNEWIAIGIVIIIVVASGKYFCSSIAELVSMISWNQLEKEKHIVLRLQDLLDRDFTIEQDDLLSSLK